MRGKKSRLCFVGGWGFPFPPFSAHVGNRAVKQDAGVVDKDRVEVSFCKVIWR